MDNQKDIQILMAIKKNILNKPIIENRTDLVSNLYGIILDRTRCNSVFEKYLKKTRVVNLYDNKNSNKYV